MAGSSSTTKTRSAEASATFVVEEDQCLAAGDHRLERLVDPGVDHRPDQIPEALDGELGNHLLLIGPRRRERVVDLDRPDDPGALGNVLARNPVGISFAVPPLVMAAHDV